MRFAWVVVAILGMWAPAMSVAQSAATIRIHDAHTAGQTVTIKGRTGQIQEALEKPGYKVFTLRDDYGDQIYVRTNGPNYPVMGATYYVTGTISEEREGLFLDTNPRQITLVYPVRNWLPVILGTAGVVLAIGLFALYTQTRPRVPWGYLEVVKGEEQGRKIELIRRRTEIGRGVDPRKGVRVFERDPAVSRRQGVIVRKGKTPVYINLSNYGTMVGTTKVEANQSIPLTSDVLLRIGKGGMLVFRTMQPLATADMTAVAYNDPQMQADSSPDVTLPGGPVR